MPVILPEARNGEWLKADYADACVLVVAYQYTGMEVVEDRRRLN